MTTLQVQVGDIIRAYDFKPMVGRYDCYVEGLVLETNNTENGFQAYKIRVNKDVFDGKEYSEPNVARFDEDVFVPWKTSMDWQGRIINLSR